MPAPPQSVGSVAVGSGRFRGRWGVAQRRHRNGGSGAVGVSHRIAGPPEGTAAPAPSVPSDDLLEDLEAHLAGGAQASAGVPLSGVAHVWHRALGTRVFSPKFPNPSGLSQGVTEEYQIELKVVTTIGYCGHCLRSESDGKRWLVDPPLPTSAGAGSRPRVQHAAGVATVTPIFGRGKRSGNSCVPQ